jgi:maltose alpha-D-glucosyltransferase/alpha-amylase
LALAGVDPSPLAEDLMGPALEQAELLGRRTAELHQALASDAGNPDFAPEPFTWHYQRALYQGMRATARRRFQQLRRSMPHMSEGARAATQGVIDRESEVLDHFRAVAAGRIHAARIRTHGDYHLGQVLYTGNDFVIIDFEGEPARPLTERRIKRPGLRDVGSMLRSFHYAAEVARIDLAQRGVTEPDSEAFRDLEAWATFWQRWMSAAFVRGYLRAAEPPVLPEDDTAIQQLLTAYLLDKAIYEIGYELGSRPDLVDIPLRGVLSILDAEADNS